jgi:hypothetical protein
MTQRVIMHEADWRGRVPGLETGGAAAPTARKFLGGKRLREPTP